MPVILLERGSCSFVTKVRNVEKAGANVALIGDSKVENSEDFIMSDDGSGHSITIPSFFIRHKTAEAFKKFFADGEEIILKVKIETGHSDGITKVDLWFSTPFDLSMTMLQTLRDFLPRFGDKVKFDLKIRSQPCLFCPEEERVRDCISDGLYCPMLPVSKDS